MNASVRAKLSSASMLAGFGAVAFLVCRPIYTHAVASWDQPPNRALPTLLLVVSLFLGIAAVVTGVLSATRRHGSWWKGIVGTVLGLVPPVLTAGAWIAALPPRVSLGDLEELRDRAVPVIERVTGLAFKSPVTVELGSNEAVVGRIETGVREQTGDAGFKHPYDYLGGYDQDTKIVCVMPDGIGKLRREGVLADAPAQEIARAVLINELVHAVDDQNGMMESKAELAAMVWTEQNRFWIRRAIQEGRSAFFGRRACAELAIASFGEFVTAAGKGRTEPDFLQEMLLERFRLVYNDGERFFTRLDEAGRADLISRASRKAPLWPHHIERPDVYAADVDGGMEERFRQAFSHLPELFPEPQWRPLPMCRESWGLVEIPRDRSLLAVLDDSHAEKRLDGLTVARWIGSFRSQAGAKRVSLHLWRFAGPEAAVEGFGLRRDIWNEDASGDKVTLETVARESPGVRAQLFVTWTEERRTGGPETHFRSLARSGAFLLATKVRGWTERDEAVAVADDLVRGLLVPLGRRLRGGAAP